MLPVNVRVIAARVVLTAAVVTGVISVASRPANSHAGADSQVGTDPSLLLRVGPADLRYLGGFRLPADEANGDGFSFGGGPIAYNGVRKTLYVGSRAGRVAEVTIPDPVTDSDVTKLPFSGYVQPFNDPTEGRLKDVGGDANLAGLLVFQQRLYGTGMIFYDANNTQTVSHFVRPLALEARGAGPMRRVWERGRTGFVAGYLAAVPPEWQSRLGGPAITGQCCVSIISRTSWGPAAFAWNPLDLARDADVAATPLLYYDSQHQTLGPHDGSNPTFGGTTQVAGLAVLARTRTALFVGSNGMGPYCYGNGTSDKSLHDTAGADGERFCYDPAASDKGQHAYPYRNQMWAYDLNDLAQVRAGRKDPWEVRPYDVWAFELPTPQPTKRLAGVAYDADGRRLFVSQRMADPDGYSYRAVIHVFQTP